MMIDKHGQPTEEETNNMAGALLLKTPQFIMALIAVGGLIAAYFITISDFKIKDIELQHRVAYLEQRVLIIENNITGLTNRVTKYHSTDIDQSERDALKIELDELKEVLQKTKEILRTQRK